MHPADSQFGGLLSWVINPTETAAQSVLCPQAAYQQTVSIDQLAATMQDSWNPSDYFTPDDVDAIVGQQQQLMQQAYSLLTKAVENANATNASDAQSSLNDAQDRLNRVASQAQDYNTAVIDARDQGLDAIYAPGMKDWALETLRATSWAAQNSYNVLCQVPSWLGTFGAVVNACQTFANVVMAIVGTVLKVGEAAYHAIEKTFSFLGWLVKWGPTIAIVAILLGGVGFLTFKYRGKLKQFAHQERS